MSNRAIIEKELTQGVVPIGTPKAYQYDTAYVESAKASVRQGLTEANTILTAIRNEYGYPFTASTAEAMTDHSKIYVYTGTTTSSLTQGHWYYWNGTAWTDGGSFNSYALETDKTLSVDGAAADAKVAGHFIRINQNQLFNVSKNTIAYKTNSSYPTGFRVGLFYDNGESGTLSSWARTYTSLTVTGASEMYVTVPTGSTSGRVTAFSSAPSFSNGADNSAILIWSKTFSSSFTWIPKDGELYYISYKIDSATTLPTTEGLFLTDPLSGRVSDVEDIVIDAETISYDFAEQKTAEYLYGWRPGQYGTNGTNITDTTHIKTQYRVQFPSTKTMVFRVPSGYTGRVNEYTSSSPGTSTFVSYVETTSGEVEVTVNPSHYYGFSVGTFVDSTLICNDNTFVSQIELELHNVTTLKEEVDRISNQTANTPSSLPSYLETEIQRVTYEVQENADLDSVVFAMFTDLHYTLLPTDGNNIKDNLCKCVREVSDKTIADFSLNNGDLYDGTTHENDCKVIQRALSFHSGQRCPHFINTGDHDNNQPTDKITPAVYAKITMPFMIQNKIVRPSDSVVAASNNFYYDVENKKTSSVKTRFVNIAISDNVLTAEQLYGWLCDEVFTDEVKTGWQFIISIHEPIDLDALVGYQRGGYYGGETTRINMNFHKLFDAINDAASWTFDTSTSGTVYYDSDGVLTTDTTATPFTWSASGSAVNMTKDFNGWTSKVRLIVSGHVHCDRFNMVAGGETKDYVTAYTACATNTNTKTDTWYTNVFGEEGITCWWTDVMNNRELGTPNEMVFDVYILNSTGAKRIRFGSGENRSCSY